MDIENIWKNQAEQSFEIQENQLDRQKSKDLVSKIISRLKLEQRVSVWLGPVILLFPLWEAQYAMAAIAVAYLALLYFYYRYILRKIGEITYKDSVLEFLQSSLNAMKWFKVHYVLLGFISFGIGFFITGTSVITEPAPLSTPWVMAALLVVTIAGSYLGYYINYHRHFKRMKKIVEELSTP